MSGTNEKKKGGFVEWKECGGRGARGDGMDVRCIHLQAHR